MAGKINSLTESDIRRFMEKVNKAPGSGPTWNCWIWKASCDRKGYGQFMLSRNNLHRAHRISFFIHNGDFDQSLAVLHKCDISRCVNPEHLFLGTIADNNRDMRTKGRHSTNGRSKLTEGQVFLIRDRHANGETNKSLSIDFEMSESQISNITNGTCFKHTPGPVSRKITPLSSETVKQIRERFKRGGITRLDLAKEFETEPSTIGRLLTGETHADTGGPTFPPPQRKRFTSEQKETIIRMTAEGSSANMLAEMFNVTPNAISVALYRHRKRLRRLD